MTSIITSTCAPLHLVIVLGLLLLLPFGPRTFAPGGVVAVVALADGDPRLEERRPLGRFEADYHRAFSSPRDRQRHRDRDRALQYDAGGEEEVDCSSEIDPAASPVDLRVSKAHASHGYDAVRLSVVTSSAEAPRLVRLPPDGEGSPSDISWTHSAPFQYRWTAQFDTGTANARCVDPDGTSKISSSAYTWGGHAESPAPDSQCLFACQADAACGHFSFYYNDETDACICELFRSCSRCVSTGRLEDALDAEGNPFQQVKEPELERDDPLLLGSGAARQDPVKFRGWTTTTKYGASFVHSVIVNVVPGVGNPFEVDGTAFAVRIPEDGQPARCVLWGDPCISSKFVGCSFGQYFDAYEKSVAMINALAEADPDDGGFDCFVLLGDNFYDSDGTITTSFWKRLSLKAMAKPLVYILGNHDIWTGGSPASGVKYDPLQYGLQYFGIDTVFSRTNASRYFDYSVDPDDPPAGSGVQYQSIGATSSIENSIGWYKFGGYGVLFFNGAYPAEQILPYFEEACDFFGDSVGEDETLLLLGHWNGNETAVSWVLPYGGQVVTPRARQLLLDLPGCSHLGSRIIYFDGHGHTNQMVPGDNGYLSGGHGILGISPSNFSVPVAADYGFTYTSSSPTRVHYCQEIFAPKSTLPQSTADFDPSTIDYEKYHAILECLAATGIDKCVHLCNSWVYFGESSGSIAASGGATAESNSTSAGAFTTRSTLVTLIALAAAPMMALLLQNLSLR